MRFKIIILTAIVAIFAAGCNNAKDSRENSVPTNIGLTAREFVGRYHAKAAERHSVLQLHSGIEKTDKGKREIFYPLGDSVVLSIELENNSEYVLEVNVFCEPKGFYERDILEKATAAYLFSIQAAGINLSEQDAFSIINELSVNLRNSSATKDGLNFTARTYDGILMFGIKSAK